ncbi:MAG: class I SAM-dependent methyltransferase [Chitinophagaceae bacterium]|nr:class I SAM-dependent methyltransferase [Chitinophagaceae bacterium]
MKRNYWENMAASYQEEIFDVLQQDKKKLLVRAIRKYSKPNQQVMDIGCAVGKWLPVLSPLFKKVIALDISTNNLKIAQQLHPGLKNVDYKRADMSNPTLRVPKVEFGICINAILTPHAKDRLVFFNNLKKCIKTNGTLVLTVPSLESYLLTRIVQQQFNIDRKEFSETISGKKALVKWKNIMQGVGEIDQVPHKHFLEEELTLNLNKSGFEVLEIKKIEYPWSTEFNRPPRWLHSPKPWDWMVVAKKD